MRQQRKQRIKLNSQRGRAIVASVAFLFVVNLDALRAQPLPSAPPAGGKSVEIGEDGKALTKDTPPPTSGTLTLLRSLEQRHGATKTIQGTFKQLKESKLFLEQTPSAGKFYFHRPDLFRTDYDPPDALTNLIIQEAIYVHTPSLNQVEVYKFNSKEERDQQLHSMLIGLGFKADELVREYEVHSSADEPAEVTELKADNQDPAKVALLHLIPKPELRDTSPFTNLKLWIDKGTLLPQKIWFEDYNGDKTTVTILKLDLDVSLDDSLFQAKFPPGTQMINKDQF